jgi:hypothetical protein
MIGPSFPEELAAAGLGRLQFSYDWATKTFSFPASVTSAQRDLFYAVYATHNPLTPSSKINPPRVTFMIIPSNIAVNLVRVGANFVESFSASTGNTAIDPLAVEYVDDLIETFSTLAESPTDTELLDFAKEVKAIEVQVSKDKRARRGFAWNGENFTLLADDLTYLNALATAVAGGFTIPANTRVRRRNGTWRVVVNADVVGLQLAATQALIDINQTVRTREGQIRSAADLTALAAVNTRV